MDDIYLGPDEDLDSDSGSSTGPDVMDEIPGMSLSSNAHIPTFHIHSSLPAPSYPAQADDLPLYNDPDLYLGPEDDIPGMYLNLNACILTLTIHELIPAQSHPAGADDLPLFNDPDLYLGPEDDLIEFDDPPAVPDSPMTGESIHIV